MENIYGVDEEEKEGVLEDAALFTTFVKQHREEKEKASAKLSISKSLVEKDELGDEEEEEEDIEDSASTTSSIAKRKLSSSLRSLLWIKRNTHQNVVSKRPSYSSLLSPPPYTTPVWIQSILVPVRVFPDIRDCTVVYLKVAIMGLR